MRVTKKAIAAEETVGADVKTVESIYVIANHPGAPLDERYKMNRDFEVYQRLGATVGNPRFYRSVVTVITNIEELTEDEYCEARKTPEFNLGLTESDYAPF